MPDSPQSVNEELTQLDVIRCVLWANPIDSRFEINPKQEEKKPEPVKQQEGKLLELAKRPKVEVDKVKIIEEAIKEPKEVVKPVEKKITLGERMKKKNPKLVFSDTDSSGDDEAKATKTVDAILAKENKAKVANDTKKPEVSAPLGLVKKNSTFDSASLFSKPKATDDAITIGFEFKRKDPSSPTEKPNLTRKDSTAPSKPGHKRSLTVFGNQTKEGNDLLLKAAAAPMFSK